MHNDPVNLRDLWGLQCLTGSDKQDSREFTQEDEDYLARTLYGEVRGESTNTKEAVAWTIRNRAEDKNRTIKEVVTQKWQYSCWNEDDPNFQAVTNPEEHSSQSVVDSKAWDECKKVAAEVLAAPKEEDITKGATHYYDDSISPPNWTIPENEPNAKEVDVSNTSDSIHFYTGVRYSVPKKN